MFEFITEISSDISEMTKKNKKLFSGEKSEKQKKLKDSIQSH